MAVVLTGALVHHHQSESVSDWKRKKERGGDGLLCIQVVLVLHFVSYNFCTQKLVALSLFFFSGSTLMPRMANGLLISWSEGGQKLQEEEKARQM